MENNAVTAIGVPVEQEPNGGRRSVAGIIAEVQGQRARYLTAVQAHEVGTRYLLAKMEALDAILDSAAAKPVKP
jgi:hypothetical protein